MAASSVLTVVLVSLIWGIIGASKDEFNEELLIKRASDHKFAGSSYEQLKFIYEHSQYSEKDYLLYPVFRIIKN